MTRGQSLLACLGGVCPRWSGLLGFSAAGMEEVLSPGIALKLS